MKTPLTTAVKTTVKTKMLCGLLTLSASSVSANEPITKALVVSKVKSALAEIKQTERRNWAFQVANYENEEGDITQSVESYNPLRASKAHWQLLSISGKTPTEQQQNKFMKEKNKPADKDGFKVSLNELVQVDTLALESITPTQFTARFDVYLERLGDEASKSLTGTLTFDREENFVKHIKISNLETFSPIFTAEIAEFNLLISFQKLNNRILPHQKNMQMKGSFAFFTEIDEVSTVTYSNYQYVGEKSGDVEP